MSIARLSLGEAKARLDVAALWRVLNFPGHPSKSCRCPMHEDQSASFSVYLGSKGALRWKCHAGCGEGGPVELLARALDINEKEACRRLLELAGGNAEVACAASRRQATPTPPPAHRMVLPVGLHSGTRADKQAVADRRGLSIAGVELAAAQGLLWFASSRGCPAWIITDRARVNAQARRQDGRTWEHIGGAKAWTLPGSRAAWPIGAQEAEDVPFVVVVEGGPDLLAAHALIVAEGRESDTAAVAMLGATNHIPEDALLFLAHKRVRLFPHTDPPGQRAAVRWTEQLERVGCTVDAFRLDGLRRTDGAEVGDLNDFVQVDPDCFEAERNELEEVLPR